MTYRAEISGGSTIFDIGTALDFAEWGAKRKRLVALVASAIVLDGFDNQVLGFAVPLLLREWHVTREVLAPVFALGFVGMVLGTIVGGMLGDKIGRRPALIASVVLFGVATGATALVEGVGQLAFCRCIAGFGLGGAMPCAATLLAELAPVRQRSMAVTLGIVCIPLGGVIGGVIAARILPVWGWRSLFMLGGIMPLGVALVLLARLPESPRYLLSRPGRHVDLARLLVRLGHRVDAGAVFVDRTDSGKSAASPLRALFDAKFRWDTLALWAAFFACLLTTYIVFNWTPTLLAQVGYDIATASVGLAAFNLGGVAGAILAAAATPRLGSRPVMLLVAIAGGLGALVLSILPAGHISSVILLIGFACEGAFVNAAQTGLYSLSSQMYPAELRSSGVGAAAGVGRIGAIASSFMGAAILAGGWFSYFLTLAIGMGITAVALGLVRKHLPAVPLHIGLKERGGAR